MTARRSTATRCMALLVGLHAAEGRRIGRDELAHALRRSVRTVHTVLKQLEARGWLELSGGGNGTAGYITVINAIAWKTADVADDCRIQPGKTADVSPKTPRIRALVLTTTTTASKQPAFPQPTIRNEYGREYPNPAWLHIQGVLRGARDRIAAARDPIAYERAILRAELERKPPQRETGEAGRVEGAPVGSSGRPEQRTLKSRAFTAGGGR